MNNRTIEKEPPQPTQQELTEMHSWAVAISRAQTDGLGGLAMMNGPTQTEPIFSD
jgi:hypothetical protein